MRIAQLSREVTYAYHGGSIELDTFTPRCLHMVGSLYDHIFLVGRVGSSEHSTAPFQHVDMFVR
jgi:hypothetical protein